MFAVNQNDQLIIFLRCMLKKASHSISWWIRETKFAVYKLCNSFLRVYLIYIPTIILLHWYQWLGEFLETIQLNIFANNIGIGNSSLSKLSDDMLAIELAYLKCVITYKSNTHQIHPSLIYQKIKSGSVYNWKVTDSKRS
jgi:hypothetical protein